MAGETRGGGRLTVNERMEDQIVRLARKAGDRGVRVPDLARLFKLGKKALKRRVDAMVRRADLFGCTIRMVQEGKYRITRLHYSGKPAAVAGAGPPSRCSVPAAAAWAAS